MEHMIFMCLMTQDVTQLDALDIHFYTEHKCFLKKVFRQIYGTANDSCVALSFANLFLGHLEK